MPKENDIAFFCLHIPDIFLKNSTEFLNKKLLMHDYVEIHLRNNSREQVLNENYTLYTTFYQHYIMHVLTKNMCYNADATETKHKLSKNIQIF